MQKSVDLLYFHVQSINIKYNKNNKDNQQESVKKMFAS
jgi:hypothetical protein